jgi:hypothetical protein
MKTKTSELLGPALDWAVAGCEGITVRKLPGSPSLFMGSGLDKWAPSRDWAQGGPIIEKKKISLGYERNSAEGGKLWDAVIPGGISLFLEYGPTPLITAMRCYVASTLGDTVEIPDAL